VNFKDTSEPWYTARLNTLGNKKWKILFGAQRPFKTPITNLSLGKTLEIGCGVGRVLQWLPNSIGVDHNSTSIEIARDRGLIAFTNKDFHLSEFAISESFDSILMAHFLEHLTQDERNSIMKEFRKYLKPEGRLVIICPQEAGFRSDSTHIQFLDFNSIKEYGLCHDFIVELAKSNPFPRLFGKLFKYNEFFMVLKSR
jgi:2-polyprenyl-3-methyl-5-hydroxy-6-metoxy-1,4-benzoquinol methylase